jgi:hypothetical protein
MEYRLTYYLNHPIHIEIGNVVKLDFQYRPGRYERFGGENMWVLVTEIHGQYFVGSLDNDRLVASRAGARNCPSAEPKIGFEDALDALKRADRTDLGTEPVRQENHRFGNRASAIRRRCHPPHRA